MPELAALALIVFAGYTVQAVSGFGSMVVCMTAGAHFIPIDRLLTLLVPLSIVQCGYLAARHHDGIEWRLLLSRVLPLMGAGVLMAPLFFGDAKSPGLRTGFALFVLVLALVEIRSAVRDAGEKRPPLPVLTGGAALLGAGVIHGIYATGGPLLVWAIGRQGLGKHAFRSTVVVVWLVLNTVLTVRYTVEGRYDGATLIDMLLVMPGVPLGIVAGEHLHKRIDERRFRLVLFVLLALAAIALLAR